MPPTVPIPYQARQRPTLKQTPAARAVQRKQRILQAGEENRAVNELRISLQNAVQQLATCFNRTEKHFWTLLHFKVKDKAKKRRTNGFNAVVRELALRENKGWYSIHLMGL